FKDAQYTSPSLSLSILMRPFLTNPLHIYRALLRECTYLPDPIARDYLRKHVISSFRAYIPSRPPKPPNAKPNLLTPERKTRALRRARHGLYTLQRANVGHTKSLLRVLCLSYGQTGARRHELLKPLLSLLPEELAAAKELGITFEVWPVHSISPRL